MRDRGTENLIETYRLLVDNVGLDHFRSVVGSQSGHLVRREGLRNLRHGDISFGRWWFGTFFW